MKKLFISQPMRDKTNDEVKNTLHELICGIDNPPEVYDILVEYFSSDDMYE